MGKIKEIERFEVLSDDEDICVFKVSHHEKNIYKGDEHNFHDYQQGNIGNCGLAAALAGMSKHQDFSKIFSRITSEIAYNKEVTKIKLNMYLQGKEEIVVIDNTLPHNKNTSTLIYARSSKFENVLIASILEKAFVKVGCSNSYKLCEGINPYFVFSRFSGSVIDVRVWKKHESKKDALYCIYRHLYYSKSVVLCVESLFGQEPDSKDTRMHAYTAIEYNQELDALKIYEPNCSEDWCVSNKNLPQDLIETADPNHGELWIKTEDLEKLTYLRVTSLLSDKKFKYVRVLTGEKKLKLDQKFVSETTFKIEVKAEARFIFNFFSNVNTKNPLLIDVESTNNNKKHKVSNKFDYDFRNDDKSVMEEIYFSVRKVTLKPDTYTFHAYREISDENLKVEKGNSCLLVEEERFHFRIASNYEFSLKEMGENGSTELESEFEAVKISDSDEGGRLVVENSNA